MGDGNGDRSTFSYSIESGMTPGLTKREWMATMIMAGLLPDLAVSTSSRIIEKLDVASNLAVLAAESLLERLGK